MQTCSFFVQKYTITDCQTLCLWCGVCMRADRRVSMCMCVSCCTGPDMVVVVVGGCSGMLLLHPAPLYVSAS